MTWDDRSLYRRVLRLAPAALRQRHAAEMEEMFLDALAEARRHGRRHVMWTWTRASLDLAATPGALEVARRHEQYLVGIIEALLAAAVDDGSVRDVDVGAFAVVLAGVGATLASTVGQAHLRSNPKSAADEVVDALLLGLRT